MGNSDSDNRSDKNEGLRATMGLMEFRNTTGRMTFRESLKQGKLQLDEDPDLGINILNQLKMYNQTHLLKHHSKLKENKQNELELVESFSKLDFATVDFVGSRLISSFSTSLRTRRT